MRFAEPGNLIWLWALAPLLLLTLFRLCARPAALAGLQRADWGSAARSHWLPQWLGAASLLVVAALLALSAAEPQWGYEQAASEAFGRDVFVALDVSRSMLARDVPPNRLARAKLLAKDLVGELLRSRRYRVGVIAFAGSASLKCPLTTVGSFALDTIERLQPDSIVRGGSNLGAAIEAAIEAADRSSGRFTDLVLISDGEDLLGGAAAAARHARDVQLAVHAVCVGDPRRGSLIPLAVERDKVRYLKYRGEPVRTRPNERLMREVAELTGGMFVPAGTRPVKLGELLLAALARKPDRRVELWLTRNMKHRYQWLLAAAAVLLAGELLLARLSTQRLAGRLALRWAAASLLAVAVGVSAACSCTAALAAAATAAAPAARQSARDRTAAAKLLANGNRLYRSGRFREAERAYRQAAERAPEPAPALFNAALAAYARGDYRAAYELFEQARSRSGISPQLRLAATFGLANAAVQLSRQSAESASRGALLRAAITAYRDVLAAGSPLELASAAGRNMLIAKRELYELQAAGAAAAGEGKPSGGARRPQRSGRQPGQRGTHGQRLNEPGISGTRRTTRSQQRSEPPNAQPPELTREQAAQLVRAAVERIAESKRIRAAGTLRQQRPTAERDW